MLSQYLVPSNRKVIFYSLVLGRQPLITLQIQNFHQRLAIYKIIRNFFIFEIISILMSKNTNNAKKNGTKFDLATDSLIKKYKNI